MTFKVRYDAVQPATEVKLSLARGIILRYDGSALNHCCWDLNTEWFHTLAPSSIQVGDGKFLARVALGVGPPTQSTSFENGQAHRRAKHSSSPLPFQPRPSTGRSPSRTGAPRCNAPRSENPHGDHTLVSARAPTTRPWDTSFSTPLSPGQCPADERVGRFTGGEPRSLPSASSPRPRP